MNDPQNNPQNEPQTCPYCDSPRFDTFEYQIRFECGTKLRFDGRTIIQPQFCRMRIELLSLRAEAARLREALKQVSALYDSPSPVRAFNMHTIARAALDKKEGQS